LVEGEGAINRLIDTFKLMPFIISAHDEKDAWRSLRDVIQLLEGAAKGIGITSGGGLVYYPDGTIEALRQALHEFTVRDGEISESLLIPGTDPSNPG
jgi:hypothetical protein